MSVICHDDWVNEYEVGNGWSIAAIGSSRSFGPLVAVAEAAATAAEAAATAARETAFQTIVTIFTNKNLLLLMEADTVCYGRKT